MTEQLYNIAKDQNETSNGLLNDIRRRSSLNRMYEKQSLALKKKLVEERKKAYDAASRKESEGKGGLGFLRDLFLLRFLRGRRGGGGFGRGGGRPPVGPTGGGLGISPRITPKNKIVPFSRGRVPTRLGGLSRVGPLAALGTGLDFTSRLGSGQNVLQASLGSGGGLAGALAGGAKGAALGSFAGPIGTLIGGIGGSILGGFAGGKIADLLSGADRRRSQELERVTKMSKKTEFSKSLDDFDVVLDKFEGKTAPLLKDFKEDKGKPLIITRFITKLKSAGIGAVIGAIAGTILTELAITAALAAAPVPGSRLVAVGRLARKIPLLAKLGRILIRVLPSRSIGGRIGERLSGDAFRKITKKWVKKNAVSPGQLKLGIKSPITKTPKVSLKDFQIQRQTKLMTDSINRKFRSSSSPIKPDNLVDRNNQLMLGRNQIDSDGFFKITRSGPGLKDSKIPVDKFIRNTPDPQVVERMSKKLNLGKKTFEPNFGQGVRKADPELGDVPNRMIDITPGFRPPGKADGGRVEAGRPYIVGEIGKELFVPDASGKIVPNEDLPSSNLLVINKEPETVVVPQATSGGSSDTPIASNTVNAYDVVAKYAQMTGLFTV